VALSRRAEDPRPGLLVLRALGLGDLLTGVPALRALRRAFPGHRLALAAPRVLEPLVQLAGVADRLLPSSGLDPVPWTGAPPDLAVNLHGSGPESHRLLQALRPRRLVAFASREAAHPGPAWDGEEHEVARWCRLLREGLGVPADPRDLVLEPPGRGTVPGVVVVHPGAASPARRWPAERFARVAAWADEHGWPVAVTGHGEEEEPLAERVRALAGVGPDAVWAGRTGLADLVDLVAGARLVVCGDTGVAHLASALRRPSVVLFGPTPPAQWGPPQDGPHTVLWHGAGRGDPHAADPDPALLAVTVEEVLEAAESRVRSAEVSAGTATRTSTPASA
jgi:ADP-heptose:LPS heptosyltransferase